MAIYITGDIHGNPERLSNKRLKPFGLELNNRDIVIVCGDFGMPWNENDKYCLNWLAEKLFTTLFCRRQPRELRFIVQLSSRNFIRR